ncbi:MULTISPECIES: competence/damage-inducible protein A [unclassified Arcicella]|uniref:competence/damage-inducible protein A n=1 Tax=unclassified Arcicella TaxID=2644986 RepID=UPI00285503CF|nr:MULTISPECIES: competence/damage-inducible protein A [unclassified Arcicella]MDR6561842.1 nicotinamide-nucleotide amidase [Arcicella sp. BE51]MDR6813988.1 nicotinamide-nucleotide amidase [Arcicella sp. BE140]MDR6825305.1 nicotinamide-nucleotide amidase [Arcicella sp. BE139]
MIRAEIITIGDEILYGQITDTNTQWISAELDKIGIRTVRKSSVGDTQEAILQIFNEATQRAELVIVTGGLGPTKDDITKKTFCKYFNTTLEVHPEALTDLQDFFRKRGREVTGLNLGQAELPANATYIKNTMGTAPGMWFEQNGVVYISMPGVPYEMKGLMTLSLLPKIQAYFKTPVIFHKVIRTVGIGESLLAEMIDAWEDALPPHIRLAYLPSMGSVKLRLTGFGEDIALLEKQVEEEFQKVLPTIQSYVYGYGNEELEEAIGRLLKEKGLTVSVAESCTGGYLGHQFTKVAGSSAYFMGGILSYDNSVKINQLSVKPETLVQFGAVSEETVVEMSENIRKLCNTTFGLATSGIAGPDGGTPDKPVGTIWIAIATESKTITKKLQLGGFREQNIHLTAINILNLLRTTWL